MKRAALLRYLEARGCMLFREGAKHSVYYNPAEGKTTTIPRHREVNDFLAKKICRDLGIPEINK